VLVSLFFFETLSFVGSALLGDVVELVDFVDQLVLCGISGLRKTLVCQRVGGVFARE